MDQALVASFRKKLEIMSTAEMRQALENRDTAIRSPEELEAMRQILEERRTNSNRTVFAVSAAIVTGTIAAVCAWWRGAPEVIVLLFGVGGAALGFASCYIRGLFAPS